MLNENQGGSEGRKRKTHLRQRLRQKRRESQRDTEMAHYQHCRQPCQLRRGAGTVQGLLRSVCGACMGSAKCKVLDLVSILKGSGWGLTACFHCIISNYQDDAKHGIFPGEYQRYKLHRTRHEEILQSSYVLQAWVIQETDGYGCCGGMMAS